MKYFLAVKYSTVKICVTNQSSVECVRSGNRPVPFLELFALVSSPCNASGRLSCYRVILITASSVVVSVTI